MQLVPDWLIATLFEVLGSGSKIALFSSHKKEK